MRICSVHRHQRSEHRHQRSEHLLRSHGLHSRHLRRSHVQHSRHRSHRHGRIHIHRSRHRGPILSVGQARFVRHFPCQTCKTSTGWCRRLPPHREGVHEGCEVDATVASPVDAVAPLANERDRPVTPNAGRTALLRRLLFFTMLPPVWALLNQSMSRTLLRYVSHKHSRKYQKV